MHHRTHLAAETVDAPASAIAQIIFDVAEREKADLVVLGANRKPVSKPAAVHMCIHLCMLLPAQDQHRADRGSVFQSSAASGSSLTPDLLCMS